MTLFFALSAPGMGEWIVILVLVLVLFGGKNLPDLARAVGNGLREFKRAMNGIGSDADPRQPSSKPDSSAESRETDRPRSS